jgi:hypothetical protein
MVVHIAAARIRAEILFLRALFIFIPLMFFIAAPILEPR